MRTPANRREGPRRPCRWRDPAAEKAAVKGALRASTEKASAGEFPVERVIDRFVAEYVAVKAGPKSAYKMERLLRHDVIPVWKGRQITSITESDIEALLKKIVARGAPLIANRVLVVLKTLFRWRPVRRLVGPSPCADVERPTSEIPRDRVLSNEELRGSYLAAADPSLGQYGQIFQLLIALCNPQLRAADRVSPQTRFKEWWNQVGAAVENVAHEYAAINQRGGEPLSFKELFKKSEECEEESVAVLGALGVIYKYWPEKSIVASDVYAYLTKTEAQYDNEEKATLRAFCLPKNKQGLSVTTNSISRALGDICGMPLPCGDGNQLTMRLEIIDNTKHFTVKKSLIPTR